MYDIGRCALTALIVLFSTFNARAPENAGAYSFRLPRTISFLTLHLCNHHMDRNSIYGMCQYVYDVSHAATQIRSNQRLLLSTDWNFHRTRKIMIIKCLAARVIAAKSIVAIEHWANEMANVRGTNSIQKNYSQTKKQFKSEIQKAKTKERERHIC